MSDFKIMAIGEVIDNASDAMKKLAKQLEQNDIVNSTLRYCADYPRLKKSLQNAIVALYDLREYAQEEKKLAEAEE